MRISSRRRTVKWTSPRARRARSGFAPAALLTPALLLVACGGEGPTAPASPPGSLPAGSPPVVTVAPEGWAHVAEGSAVSYQSNPPAS
ncbi:MAG TPA: hypothetical protein VMT87_03440, partial [Vicinamibacteria bacterium]|nr:hypothetical protein [Vicinamibacteria bacterium]